MRIIKKFTDWLKGAGYYVVADATDNSITLSRRLCERMDVMGNDKAKVMVFRLNDEQRQYAFALNPPVTQETQLADVQYNATHRCVGFESLVPTVNRIFYDYGLPPYATVKLSVRIGHAGAMEYFIICKPPRRWKA